MFLLSCSDTLGSSEFMIYNEAYNTRRIRLFISLRCVGRTGKLNLKNIRGRMKLHIVGVSLSQMATGGSCIIL